MLPLTLLAQNIHAVGDRANVIILDAFENALKNTNVTTLRPRLEHTQLMTNRDMVLWSRTTPIGYLGQGSFGLSSTEGSDG
jgi:hypothetical protein